MPKLAKITLFCVILGLILVRCDRNPYPKNPDEFKAVVSTWNLQALSASKASGILEINGFNVSRHKPKHYFKDQRDYIYAVRSKSALVCLTEWRVILPLHEGKVAETNPSVALTCL